MDASAMKVAFRKRWGDEKGHWLYDCATNAPARCEDQPERIKALWEAAGDMDAFMDALRRDRYLARTSQAWAEIGIAEAGGDKYAFQRYHLDNQGRDSDGLWPLVIDENRVTSRHFNDGLGSLALGDVAGSRKEHAMNRRKKAFAWATRCTARWRLPGASTLRTTTAPISSGFWKRSGGSPAELGGDLRGCQEERDEGR